MSAGGTALWETASVAMALTLAASFAVALALENQPYRGVDRVVQHSEPEPSAAVPKSRAAAAAEAADLALRARIADHSQCLNFSSRTLLHARKTYLRSIDAKAGPRGSEGGLWLDAPDTTRCVAGLEQARARKPDLPELDRASDVYLASLAALAPLLDEASSYYASKGYQRDHWAKAKAMHPALVAAFGDFERAHAALDRAVQQIDAGLVARRLERLEQAPSARLEYLALKTLSDARALQKLAAAAGTETLDEAPYERALFRYRDTAAAYEQYIDAHPEEASRVDAMGLFRAQVSALSKSATQLLWTDPSVGHAEVVVSECNELGSRFNRLTFRR